MENIKNNEIRIIVTMLCATAGVMRDLQIPREVAMDFFVLALDKAYEEAEDA